tara:strand:- start:1147 stop:1500 length:354 start_codon:yes stop_codon:yes gene_type:complete
VKTKKYRNKFEEQVGIILGNSFSYEKFKIPYVVHRNYIPDFVNGHTLIECKGFFRAGDVQKYKAIKNSLHLPDELVFVLHNPRKKLRKGSKMNMSEWCEKEGFRWFTVDTIRNVFTS